MKLVSQLLAYVRNCPTCGTSLGFIDWLCPRCSARLFSEFGQSRKKNVLINESISVFYLLDWPVEDSFMTAVVHSLKGGKLPEAFRSLAEVFLLEHGFQSSSPLIYYPSRGSLDHAFAWSLALSNLTHSSFLPLELVSRRKQAKLSRRERYQVSFVREKPQRNSRLIFADDIVTTGSTAVAAWKALGQPKSFAVWSLFHRRSL